MSVPFVRAARVYDRTVHWRETTYHGYALHQTSLSQMEMAPHTQCDNCHEKLEPLGIRLESCQSCTLLFWICASTLQQMGLISRLVNCGVRMEMIDYDCSILQMIVQSKQSITHTNLSQISPDQKVKYIKTHSVLHVSHYFALKCPSKAHITINLSS